MNPVYFKEQIMKLLGRQDVQLKLDGSSWQEFTLAREDDIKGHGDLNIKLMLK